MKIKLTWKIWLLIIVLALSFLALFPFTFFQDGVLVTSVEPNSTAFEQGFRADQIITAIDGEKVENVEDFSALFQGKFTSNQTTKMIFSTQDSQIIYFSNQTPEITVSELSKTKVKLGLDLVGGARALIQAEDRKLSSSEIGDLVSITENRLNEFGLTDLKVRPVSDLAGNNFMLIEIAGATPKDLRDLISQQGKFEAKIGNETVFIGGKDRDIASVCRGDPTCARVENPQASNGGYVAQFSFEITLSGDAARRHAEITEDLKVNSTPQGNYLEKQLDLYLDDQLVDSLLISEGLKGRITTQIQISGSGSGETQELAYQDAETSMHQLQTILITGSLPYKLKIVKLDTISPILGSEFLKSILIAGVTALLAVALIIFIRYRKFKSSIALLITSISEIIIILGIASLIEWNLDLPSIAGILVVVGTGIDQQIIILDEARRSTFLSIKQRMKRAFAIILGAYFTAVVAMLPLLWAGAGLLKGFAFTTIIGITAGVLITRPAFTDMVKKIEE
jgi:preprotein translocase subunit SecD